MKIGACLFRPLRFVLLLISVLISACATPAATLLPTASAPTDATPNTAAPSPAATSQPPASTPAMVAQSSRARLNSPQVDSTQGAALTAGNNSFAFDLYRAIRAGKGNLFYSPYSVSQALAMTYAGARNNTEQQMANALHFTLPQAQLHAAFNAQDQKLGRPAHANGDFSLNLANALWGQSGFPFQPAFLDTLAENYGAGMRLADFVGDGSREQARQDINQWVKDKTAGKIQDLLVKGILSEKTRLVLVNAIYFKADWDVPFTRGTRNGEFTPLDSSPVTVPMMSRRATAGYAKGVDYEAVEIAYQCGRMRLLALMPAAGQFAAFEGTLTTERVDAIARGLHAGELLLSMPKFQYYASLRLNDSLSTLGMSDAFDAGRADFSGMTGQSNLFIAHVVHKAFVAVDEKGTEAAAATGVVTELTSMPVSLTLNRPFIFVIRDGESGAVLFVGRLLDPRQ